MRITIDLPDHIYRELKMRAAGAGTTIGRVILEGIALRLRSSAALPSQESRPRFPVIASRKPGSLKFGEEGVYEFIAFP